MTTIIEQRGNFKVTGRRVAYENPWIRVIEDQVIRPDGNPGIYGVIEIGKGKGGVAILPVDRDLNVYLIEEFAYAQNENTLEVAGGGVDEAEDAAAAAHRETSEELGITKFDLVPFGKTDSSISIKRGPSYMFLAHNFDPAEFRPEPGIHIHKLALTDAVDMVMAGKILASTTCVLILMAARHFKI